MKQDLHPLTTSGMKKLTILLIMTMLLVACSSGSSSSFKAEDSGGIFKKTPKKIELSQVEVEEVPIEMESESKYLKNAVDDPSVEYYGHVVDPRSVDARVVFAINNRTLVNKFNRLPDEYHPQDLEWIETNSYDGYMRSDAAEAWNRLFYDARDEGIEMVVFSSFRTIYDQEELFFGNFDNDPAWSFLYVAYPRRSEHEMGLAVDVSYIHGFPEDFENTAQGIFLHDRGADYGFIHRYQRGKEHITGYAHESWHFRYVGPELARIIKESGDTLEEYYGLYTDKEEVLGKLILTREGEVWYEPSYDSDYLDWLPKGQIFKYFEVQDSWYRIDFNGQPAWINLEDVEILS